MHRVELFHSHAAVGFGHLGRVADASSLVADAAAVPVVSQHEVIEADEIFRGTLTQTSVYPREVVKEALRHNAAAVIFYHNHPSGAAEPSPADEMLTRQLKDALNLVDVRVLDHFVVTAEQTTSFAEKGLL